MVDIHPPKQETFDVTAGINIDPKGFSRPVDRWERTDRALYMARPADHPRFGYLESWLIPDLGIRVSRFHFREGEGGTFPGQELYVDIADITVGDGDTDGDVWHSTDLYVDVVTYAGGRWEILDLEELGGALAHGHVDADTTSRALESSQRLVSGMLTAGGVEEWLAAEGISVGWADSVTLAPAE
ncbi:MAG: DUF402 domain-containing protein [Mycobacteriaceae bacterium]|uniref:DUF402 domain-containing protein n=1 Tax=Corynebacterium sp. TaxID=1720 RepID=UPI003F985399